LPHQNVISLPLVIVKETGRQCGTGPSVTIYRGVKSNTRYRCSKMIQLASQGLIRKWGVMVAHIDAEDCLIKVVSNFLYGTSLERYPTLVCYRPIAPIIFHSYRFYRKSQISPRHLAPFLSSCQFYSIWILPIVHTRSSLPLE